MTDITINIKIGSENSELKITTSTDNAKTVTPKAESTKAESIKAESTKAESPKAETPKEKMKDETTSENETPKKDGSIIMDMTEEEHAKMSADKNNPSAKAAPKHEVPKEEMKEAAPFEKVVSKEKSLKTEDSKKMKMTEEEHAKMSAKK